MEITLHERPNNKQSKLEVAVDQATEDWFGKYPNIKVGAELITDTQIAAYAELVGVKDEVEETVNLTSLSKGRGSAETLAELCELCKKYEDQLEISCNNV